MPKKKASRGASRPQSARTRGGHRGRTVRYAVVGLGYISQAAVLPSFRHASENSRLAALVSDDPVKLEKLARRYRVPHTTGYDGYADLLASGEVDAVYIALPNHMHRDYSVAAAEAGIHVLCEKPMAVTEEECDDMIRAAEEHGVRLMIAYRLHFEKANLKSIEIVRSGRLGEPRIFHSVFSNQVEEGNIRLESSERGGGPLYDIGVYCINAARYLFRAEPSEVLAATASLGERRFQKSYEMASAVLRFPVERLATFTVSFGAADAGWYQVLGTRGELRLDPAYEFADALTQTVTIDGKSRQTKFPKRDQFAPELIYFSDCVLQEKDPEPSGREGLADVRIVRALLESARIGGAVKLAEFERGRRPTIDQEIQRPPVAKPRLVHAESPSGK